VNGDLTPEVDEIFFIRLTAPEGVVVSDADGVGSIVNDDEVAAIPTPPTGTIGPASPTLTIPVTIARDTATPLLGYSVRLHLSDLMLAGPGLTGITEGPFLQANNPQTSFHVVDHGGGSYTVDDVTLGAPCGSSETTGTLFSLAVGSSALTGPGTVTIDEVTVYDCDNVASPYPIGSAASVAIDYTLPVVTVTAPNGGEFSPPAITWTATDNVGIATVDLAYSTDGGATFPYEIATGIANTGTYAWDTPVVLTTEARVRVTAHDVNGNVASDASDADFTTGQYLLTVNVDHGTVSRVPDQPAYNDGTEVTLTALPAAGYHFESWSGDASGTTNPVTITMNGHKTVTAAIVVNPPVEAITALAVSQVREGNDTDGTTQVEVTWPAVPAGDEVQVYRAGFGHYPGYDDLGGVVPVAPVYPPDAPWVLTAVTTPGMTDEPPARDFYYYVAFVTDQYGTHSPVSNLAGGALNYHLGDVSDGVTLGQGDNHVDIADLSLLGDHYGASGALLSGYEYLDVGPTTDRSVHGRPTTDGQVNIEDLIVFALNYSAVSAPALAAEGPGGSGAEELTLRVTEPEPERVVANLELKGAGGIQALSAALEWNAAVVEPTGVTEGQWLRDQGGIALSPAPGTVDVALLGARAQGVSGEGEVATVTFLRLAAGADGIAFKTVMARDAQNRDVALTTKRATVARAIPTKTSFTAAQPNPFQEATTLSFNLSETGPAELVIYSVDGRRVRKLDQGMREAGQHHVAWDGRDDLGQPVHAGIYYARLSTRLGPFQHRLVRLR
jgi:hypothetical protein